MSFVRRLCVRVAGRAFFLGGWAADLDSDIDRGVDAVHVWAYPVNERGERELPLFLGPATYGSARPDVAANLRPAIPRHRLWNGCASRAGRV